MNELYDTPKHQDLIYDIGMHEGQDTEFYLRKNFRVVAFEADPDLATYCRNRFKEFINREQLTVVEGAIVDSATIKAGHHSVRFYKNDRVSAWGTVVAEWADRNQRLGTSNSMIEVKVVEFTNILQHHGVPHYMKIDIEGVDMVCVDALRSFRERPDYLSIESDKTSFANIKREIDTLVELGYDSFRAVEQSAIPNSQTPPNPASEGDYVTQRFEPGSSGLFGAELGNRWKPRLSILRQYRFIRVGYYLLGDHGKLCRWKFRGAGRLRSLTGRFLRLLTKEAVPGWYDTHARHCCVKADEA